MSLPYPTVRIIRRNWVVPRGYGGITFGNWIFIRHDVYVTVPWLAHELMHVLQWRRYGVAGFIWRYGWTFARDGFRYENIDIEEEARSPSPYTLEWATALLREGTV